MLHRESAASGGIFSAAPIDQSFSNWSPFSSVTQCLAVNLGNTPRDVTFTELFADGSARSQTITVEPNIVRDVENTGVNACEFQSGDVTLIRGSGAVLDFNRNALQIIPAN